MSVKKQQGRLIVLEGPDGVGKSTIAKEVFGLCRNQGEDVELLAFPGNQNGTLGHLVYDIHHNSARYGLRELGAATLQALHIASHLDAIDSYIIPALRQGKTIVLDRFWWSTLVYGLVSGANPKVLEALITAECHAWGTVLPHVVIVLRRESPINRDESLDRWRCLRDEYDRLAQREEGNYPITVLENTGSLEDILKSVRIVLQIEKQKRPRARKSAPDQLNMGFSPSSRPPQPAPMVYVHLSPVKPRSVYDTFWRFAAERQSIFFKRFHRDPPPWTEDRIFVDYKFTNAYRASDRVSQYLIKNVIYRDDLPKTANEIFFRIMLFKVFNKIETWKLIERRVGAVVLDNCSFDRLDEILTEAQCGGEAIYSAAYIMPSGSTSFGHSRKHRNHLKLIEQMIADDLPQRIADTRTMQEGFALLRSYPTIGDFLAYQYITDINYSELTDFSEMQFVVPGPGALDGIRKCFAELGGLNESEIIKFIAERQEKEFERLGLNFQSLWGRNLQLIDCQNLFCEVDKYARVYHPEIEGRSGRTRIKQRFMPSRDPLTLWYPPKWKINDLIKREHNAILEVSKEL